MDSPVMSPPGQKSKETPRPYAEQFAGLEPTRSYGSLIVPQCANKAELLDSLIKTEEEYVKALRDFKESFIDLIEKRDNEDRRRLFDDPKLAVTLGMFQSIGDWNQSFADGLRSCIKEDSMKQLADLMMNFAPGLRLYASYASNNSETLNALAKLDTVLGRMLKQNPLRGGLPIQKVLYLPCERYPVYQQYLAELMTFVPSHDADFERLSEAYKVISEGTQFVETTLREQAVQLELLTLQSQFIGQVDIFAPNRRLIRDGPMVKIRLDKNNQRTESQVYAHLFNDALLYSTRLPGMGYFKVSPFPSMRGGKRELTHIISLA